MNEMKRLLSFVRRAVDDYNMIEDGAYKDDNGYFVVHAYDPLEQPDPYGWQNSFYVRATDEDCNNIIEVRAWCPYSKTEGFL